MAPTPVRMNGTRAPVAKVLLATAMPTWPVLSSWAMIEKVIGASRVFSLGSAATMPLGGRLTQDASARRGRAIELTAVNGVRPPCHDEAINCNGLARGLTPHGPPHSKQLVCARIQASSDSRP